MKGMVERLRERWVRLLRVSERYLGTDMTYLTSSGLWLTIGQAGAILITLLLAIAFGHLASQDTYGNYKYVLTIAGLLSTLSLSGLSTGITRSAASGYDGSLVQGFRLNLRWSGPLVGVAFVAAVYYYFFQHNIFLAASLAIIGVATPLLNGVSLYDSFLNGKKAFKKDTLYYLLENSAVTICIVALIVLRARAIILVSAYFAVSTAMTAFFYWRVKRSARNADEDPELFRYSAHLSVMNVIGAIADKIDSIAIFSFLGPAQLAIYSFALAIPEQVKGALKNIVTISMPKFAARSIPEIRATIGKRVLILAFILLIGIAAYVILVPYLFAFFFPVYVGAVPYTRVYALSLVFIACTSPFISILQAHKRTKELYITTNVSSGVLVIALPLFTVLYGVWGALMTQFAYRALRMSLAAWQFWRIKDDAR